MTEKRINRGHELEDLAAEIAAAPYLEMSPEERQEFLRQAELVVLEWVEVLTKQVDMLEKMGQAYTEKHEHE